MSRIARERIGAAHLHERELNRWLALVKWLLAISHYFILFL